MSACIYKHVEVFVQKCIQYQIFKMVYCSNSARSQEESFSFCFFFFFGLSGLQPLKETLLTENYFQMKSVTLL